MILTIYNRCLDAILVVYLAICVIINASRLCVARSRNDGPARPFLYNYVRFRRDGGFRRGGNDRQRFNRGRYARGFRAGLGAVFRPGVDGRGGRNRECTINQRRPFGVGEGGGTHTAADFVPQRIARTA